MEQKEFLALELFQLDHLIAVDSWQTEVDVRQTFFGFVVGAGSLAMERLRHNAGQQYCNK